MDSCLTGTCSCVVPMDNKRAMGDSFSTLSAYLLPYGLPVLSPLRPWNPEVFPYPTAHELMHSPFSGLDAKNRLITEY